MGFQTEAPAPVIPRFGDTYSRAEHDRLTRALEMLITMLNANGPIQVSGFRLVNFPTSPTGLTSGQVWINGTALEVVP